MTYHSSISDRPGGLLIKIFGEYLFHLKKNATINYNATIRSYKSKKLKSVFSVLTIIEIDIWNKIIEITEKKLLSKI